MAQRHEGPSRRRFRRAEVDFPVTVIVPGSELVLDGKALDLSGGGVRVGTTSDLPAGQSVLLRFIIPSSTREALVRGRIVLSFFDAGTKCYAHGVAFTQISHEDQAQIEKHLDKVVESAKP